MMGVERCGDKEGEKDVDAMVRGMMEVRRGGGGKGCYVGWGGDDGDVRAFSAGRAGGNDGGGVEGGGDGGGGDGGGGEGGWSDGGSHACAFGIASAD